MSAAAAAHDFRRDGSRTVWSLRHSPWTFWVEERAMWHHDRTATFGASITRRGRWLHVSLELGRWSVEASFR